MQDLITLIELLQLDIFKQNQHKVSSVHAQKLPYFMMLVFGV